MLCSVQEFQWTLAPSWQGEQRFPGHFPEFLFSSYALLSWRIFCATVTQNQTHDLTEKWGIYRSLQAEQQSPVFRGALALLCRVHRPCALRQTACAGAGQSRGRGCHCHERGLGEAALSLHPEACCLGSPRLLAQHRSGPPQNLRFKET